MANSIFITGTDTGVGKTVVTALLGRAITEGGVKTITQKWVQTGCSGISEDIAFHMRFIDGGGEYIREYHSDMAPYVFEFPSSPHLAALLEEKDIDPGRIEGAFRCLEKKFDFILVEGTGGMLVPLNEEKTIADIVEKLRLPVLVVVENRLGAINQTLLTVEAVRKRDLEIAGLIFNRARQGEDETVLKDNLRIVEKFTGIEVLGELPYNTDMDILYNTFIPIGEKILNALR